MEHRCPSEQSVEDQENYNSLTPSLFSVTNLQLTDGSVSATEIKTSLAPDTGSEKAVMITPKEQER